MRARASADHARAWTVAGALVGAPRDLFDRKLVAQAREEKLALVSNEGLFDEFGLTRVW